MNFYCGMVKHFYDSQSQLINHQQNHELRNIKIVGQNLKRQSKVITSIAIKLNPKGNRRREIRAEGKFKLN